MPVDAEDRPIPATWSSWTSQLQAASLAMRRRALHAPGCREAHGDALRLNLVLTADLADLTYRLPPRDWSGLDVLDPAEHATAGSAVMIWAAGAWARRPEDQ